MDIGRIKNLLITRHGLMVISVILLGLIDTSLARQFIVGGSSGWVVNPSENYTQWSGRNRFRINDTLLFRYNGASDSVLVVNQSQFNSCNLTNPIQRFNNGNTVITLNRSGPFFFISGASNNCARGQKLRVVVLSPKNSNPSPSPPSPSPSSSTSPSPAPAPAPSGSSPSPAPSGSSTSPPPSSSGSSTPAASPPSNSSSSSPPPPPPPGGSAATSLLLGTSAACLKAVAVTVIIIGFTLVY